ncbi:MAG: cation diffusion facilitator family transporter [Acidocella sp.]|nr:cation diffusion facilitator family transporter [Acidocella sp.]
MSAQHPHGHDDHDHHSHHDHHHVPATFGSAFAIGIALNLAYLVGEVFYGIFAHSLALLADAGHNAGDVLGLATAWAASIMVKLRPSRRYTYGLRRTSILAALGNAIMLLIITGAIAWEGVLRLLHPEPTGGVVIMAVAAIGIFINGATALLFMAGRKDDINIKGAFTHMLADAAVALGVVIAGAVIFVTGWLWVDPVISFVVSGVIVMGTWSLLRDSMSLALDAVPPGVNAAKVDAFLRALPGVTTIHDLHIWGMSTTETALTAHLVRPGAGLDDDLLHEAAAELKAHYGISHATFQVEDGSGAHICALHADETV